MARTGDACIKTMRSLAGTAAARGHDILPLLAARGFDAARLTDPYARVPVPLVAQLWREVPELVGDDAFGLHAAELTYARTEVALDGALWHYPTLGAAYRAFARHSRLLLDGAKIATGREGAEGFYEVRLPAAPPMPPAFSDMIAAMWWLRTRHILGGPPPVREVCLPRSPPSDLGEHRRLLGGPFRWEGPSVRFTFDAALLDVPIGGADTTLGVVLDRHLEEQTAQLPADDDLLTSIRRAIADDLSEGAPDLDRIARRLAMSRRTLQRALQREGTSFQRLVDDTRRELAMARLRDPRLTLSELAFLVGFSELSAFDRAFRRWTGQSPGAYRAASPAVALDSDRAPVST